METRRNKRVVGVIQKDNKILLIRRIKNEEEYYVFPGGAVENNESEEKALKREIEEETSLIIGEESKRLFEMENQGRWEIYYLIKEFTGVPRIQGPEKKRMGIDNQYILEWKNITEIKGMKNLYPREIVEKLFLYLTRSN